MAPMLCAARGGVATTSASSRAARGGVARGDAGTRRAVVTFCDAPRPRLRTRVSPRARGRRDGRVDDGRAAWDRRAGADDLGKLDTERDALSDVSGSAPDAFGAAARGETADDADRTTETKERKNDVDVDKRGAVVASVSRAEDASQRRGSEPLETRLENTPSIASFAFPRSADDLRERWRLLPSRYRVILGTTCAFVLCNMDKVNISVAIIPMAKEMGWSVGQAGLLQSAFFYGFALSQLPGGYLATRFGGARMLPLGVFLWSAATVAVPFVADDQNALFFSRVLVGLGEGISPAAATDVIARAVPVTERSRAVAFVFNGFNVGSVLGLSLAPLIIENFGWRTVFVAFGGLGVFWVAWVGLGIYPRGGAVADATNGVETNRDLTPVEGLVGKRRPASETADGPTAMGSDATKRNDEDRAVPWRAILSSTPMRALAYVHFCNNWGFYVLLAWLPSYFTQELGVTLTNASLFTLLPPLANIAVASAVGPLADDALARGVDVTTVRKTAQTLALCGPATFMALASFHFGDDESGLVTVALITAGVSLSSFSYAGLYCNHQDMSPRFASILLGMTNTVGALPGVIGVPLTGYLLQKTENWELSMFLPAIALYFSGAAVFAKYGSGEKQAWG